MKKSIVLIAVALFVSSCYKSDNQSKPITEAVVSDEQIMKSESLKELLDIQAEHYKATTEPSDYRSLENSISAVFDKGVFKRSVNIFDEAPDFELKSANGATISLNKSLKSGTVALMFFRGNWCPYSKIALRYYNKYAKELEELGCKLYAISPQLPDSSSAIAKRYNLQYELLYDKDNSVARRYGIVYQLEKEVSEYYGRYFEMASYNSNEDNELPATALYLLDSTSKVKYVFLDSDYKNWAEPDDVLQEVLRLKMGPNGNKFHQPINMKAHS